MLIFGSACTGVADPAEGDVEIASASYGIVSGVADNVDLAVGMLSVDLTQTCTLTMVFDAFALTARHCVLRRKRLPDGREVVDFDSPYDPRGMQVSFSSEPNVDPNAFWYGVKTYRFHPEADIAVIQLTGVPPNHMPMNVTPIDNMVGSPVRIAGYGKTGTNQFDTGIRRNGYSTLFQTATMRDLGEVMITGVAEGDNGSKLCQGDSGGPIFMVIDGEEKLVGVNSVVARQGQRSGGGQIPCEPADTVNAHVRVDTRMNQDFIHESIADMQGGHTALIGACSASGGGSASCLFALAFGWLALRRRTRRSLPCPL